MTTTTAQRVLAHCNAANASDLSRFDCTGRDGQRHALVKGVAICPVCTLADVMTERETAAMYAADLIARPAPVVLPVYVGGCAGSGEAVVRDCLTGMGAATFAHCHECKSSQRVTFMRRDESGHGVYRLHGHEATA